VIALAACLGGLMIGLAATVVLVPLVRRTGVRARVGEFISGPMRVVKMAQMGDLEPPAPGPAERVLERLSWWKRFKEDVEIARIDRPAIEIVYLTALATIVVAAVLYLLLKSPLIILAAAIAGPLIMRGIVNQRLGAQRRLFSDQLAGHLQEIAAAMRSGHSIVGAIRAMTDGATEPTSGEFRRALADEELGMSLEQSLEPIVRRMASDDVDQVALVISLHRRAGGNMAEVLDRLSEGVRQRAELRRELHSLTAQARLSRWIVTALPVVILVMVSITSSTYIRPLFHTTGGVVLLVLAGAMVVLGSLVMRAIVDIDP
jgi:tight adherence protein B